MTQERSSVEPSPFQCRALFVSDFHLASAKTAAPHLYEFLKNVDFAGLEDLYLVGDVIGGWENVNQEQRPFPEMEKRVLDVLNYAVDQGVKVHFIPGNHDEKLRGILDKLAKRKSFDTFPQNVIFENEAVFETGGPQSKKLKVLHGDQYDPPIFNQEWFKPLMHMTSAIYDGLTVLDEGVARATKWAFGRELRFAKQIAQGFSAVVDHFSSDDDVLVKLNREGLDGMIIGHTHIAEEKVFDRFGRKMHLINSGDWVENANFVYTAKEGDIPKVVNYKAERVKRGLSGPPQGEDAPHEARFAAMREKTEAQVRMVQMFWPASDRRQLIDVYHESLKEIRQTQMEKERLKKVAERLRGWDGVIDEQMQRDIGLVVEDENNPKEKKEKEKLTKIFNKYRLRQKMGERDLARAGKLVEAFMKESGDEIRKYTNDLGEAARRLSFRIFKGPGNPQG